MRRLKDLYPDYADQVAFYAVGTDPTEDLPRMEEYRQQQGYPWPVAEPVGSMLRDFQVVVQSTKIAFDSQGMILYREGYGQGDVDTWRRVFRELAASRAD